MTRLALLFLALLPAVTVLSAADPEPLRIATFNIRITVDKAPNDWKSRSPRVCKIITDNDFHLFGVQEAFHPKQIKDLQKIPGYAAFNGGNKKIGTARRDTIFYKTDRLELLDQGVFMLSETPDVPKSKGWDAYQERMAVWGKFRDKVTGRVFIHYNTHLDNKGTVARLNSIKLIRSHAKKNAAGIPVILSGDFNARPDSDVYREAAAEWKDAFKATEKEPAGTFWTLNKYSLAERPGTRIDYIFITPGTRVLSYCVINTLIDNQFPSDHYPVMAEIIME